MKMHIEKKDDLGPLHALLLKACPPDRQGKKSITVLARKLEISTQSIYQWIDRGRLPAFQAKRIVELHEEWRHSLPAQEELNVEHVAVSDFDQFVP